MVDSPLEIRQVLGGVGGVEAGHPHLHRPGVDEHDVLAAERGAGVGDDPGRVQWAAVIGPAAVEFVA
jgi:hypothetical protein